MDAFACNGNIKTTVRVADEGGQVELACVIKYRVWCGCSTVGALTLFSRLHTNLMLYRSTPWRRCSTESPCARLLSFHWKLKVGRWREGTSTGQLMRAGGCVCVVCGITTTVCIHMRLRLLPRVRLMAWWWLASYSPVLVVCPFDHA